MSVPPGLEIAFCRDRKGSAPLVTPHEPIHISHPHGDALMELASLDGLFLHDLRDVYSAEQQIRSALPEMIAATRTERLRRLLEEYQAVVTRHADGVTQLFQQLNGDPNGKPCRAIEALLQADKTLISLDADPYVMDAALIGAVQRMVHYKLAAYGCVRTYARLLGKPAIAERLQQHLDDEGRADDQFNAAAARINVQAR